MSNSHYRHRRPMKRSASLLILLLSLAIAALLAAVPALQAAASRVPKSVVVERSLEHGLGKTVGKRSAEAPITANLVGASWEGSADELFVRSKDGDGRWQAWQPLVYDVNEGPDAASAEGRRARERSAGRKFAAVPVWIGSARHLQFKVRGRGRSASNINVVYINTTGTATPVAKARSGLMAAVRSIVGVSPSASASPTGPAIITRAQWGADESIRGTTTTYSAPLKAGVLHHTVNANSYRKSQAAALVRGIYSYHVRGNGWNDIGYNFLVDRYGQVFEGRHGGTTNNILGAHTGGFNTSTTGVALLGTYSASGMTTPQRSSVVKLLSWRLDLGHVRASGKALLTSSGNSKYRQGKVVRIRNLSGHRDLFFTSCPGYIAYKTINSLRTQVWLAGGPKFANPTASFTRAGDGTINNLVIRAVGNRALMYTATLTRTSDSAPVATLVGSGVNANLTWDGTSLVGPLQPWEVTWKLQAVANGVNATAYQKTLVPIPPQIHADQFAVVPPLVSPNGDGMQDGLRIHLRLNTAAQVDLEIVEDANHANVVRNVYAAQLLAGGSRTIVTSATTNAATALPDGQYAAHITAHDEIGRPDSEAWATFTVDSALALAAIPAYLSPNGDGRFDTLPVSVTVIGPLATQVFVLRNNSALRTLVNDPAANGTTQSVFDGSNGSGTIFADGTYQIAARATTANQLDVRRTFVIDRKLPTGKARRYRTGDLYLWFSERVIVYGKVRGVVRSHGYQARKWIHTRRFPGTQRLVLQDRAGNRSALKIMRTR